MISPALPCLPAPRFDTSFGGLQLEFRFNLSGSNKSSVKDSLKIIELISGNDKITITEIAQIIGISARAVEKHLAKFSSKNANV